MKKILSYFLPILSVFALHSCTFSTTSHFHDDKTTSILADLDATEFMATMKSMGGDSLSKSTDFGSDKLPKTWQSAYNLELKDGKITKDPDSIKLLKKIFMKGNFNKDEFTGFSIKMDRATDQELNGFYSSMQKDKMATIFSNAYSAWDGKQLEIDTQKFLIDKNKLAENGDEDGNAMSGMLDMIDLKMKNTLVFDSKIKSIQGKHDWVKQIDDKTVVIEYDSKSATDPNYKFTNNDPKIIIKIK